MNIHNNRGMTPLHMACENGHLGATKLLLENNAKLNAVDYFGETPLFKSVRGGNKTITKYLISNHAFVNNTNKVSEKLIHIAVMFDDFDLAEVLLKVEQNPDPKTAAGNLIVSRHFGSGTQESISRSIFSICLFFLSACRSNSTTTYSLISLFVK